MGRILTSIALFVVLVAIGISAGYFLSEMKPATDLKDLASDQASPETTGFESVKTPSSEDLEEAPVAEAVSDSDSEGVEESVPELAKDFPKIPSLASIREEIARNPHGIPTVLLDFSQQVAPYVEQGLKDGDAAKDIFENLAGCARMNSESAALPVRAFCLGSALRLAQRHPQELRSDSKRLLRDVDQDVQLLATATVN